MLLCVTVTHFPLAYTTFSWPLDIEVRITNSKVMTGSSLSFYFNWCRFHIYTHPPPPVHTYSFINTNNQMTWSNMSYCFNNTIFGIFAPGRSSIVLLPGRAAFAGFKRSQFSLHLQSGKSLAALLYPLWVCWKIRIFRLGTLLDLVSHHLAGREVSKGGINTAKQQNLGCKSFLSYDW